MKKAKEEPSVAGLLLLVTGMLLLSMMALNWAGSGGVSGDNGKFMIALASGAVICLAAGTVLSARKRKPPKSQGHRG